MASEIVSGVPGEADPLASLRSAINRFADLLPLIAPSWPHKRDMVIIAGEFRHHATMMVDYAASRHGWKEFTAEIRSGTSRLHDMLDQLSAKAFLARMEPRQFDDMAYAATLLRMPKAEVAGLLREKETGKAGSATDYLVMLAGDGGNPGIQITAEQTKQLVLQILTLLEGGLDERYRRWVTILATILRAADQRLRIGQAASGTLDTAKRDCFVQVYVNDVRASNLDIGVDWTLEFIVDGRPFSVNRTLNATRMPAGNYQFDDLPIIVGDPFPKGKCGEEVTVSVKMRATEHDWGQNDVGESPARDFTKICPNAMWGRHLIATVTEDTNSTTIDAEVMVVWICAGDEFPGPSSREF